MKPLLVSVTRAHVAESRRGSVSRNPAALAMSEATGCDCYVSGVAVSVPGRFYAPAPPWLSALLDCFDRAGRLAPFAFVLSGEPGARRVRLAGGEDPSLHASPETLHASP